VTRTREQCCRVYQRCQQITNYFRCSVVKKHSCWWVGGARGDVHLLDSKGDWRTLNVAGTVKYFADEKRRVSVYLQFKQVGSGSEVSGVAVNADNNIVQAENGQVKVNGKVITSFPAQVGKGQLDNRKNIYTLTGFGYERIAFERLGDASYTIDLGIKVGANVESKGLIFDMPNPEKYQLSNQDSNKYFSSFIPFSNIVQRQKSLSLPMKKLRSLCCKHLKNVDVKKHTQCKEDFASTGKCYDTYKQSNEDLIKKITKKK